MRRVCWLNDNGGLKPIDDAGPNIQITLSEILKGQLLSLYLCDFDWHETTHPRQQSMIIQDDDGNLLGAVWSGKLDKGVYERLLVTQTVRPRLRVIKHRCSCVAVSALFTDSMPAFSDGSPLTQQNIQAFASGLPPSIVPQLRIALAAETTFDVPEAASVFRDAIVRINSLEDAITLMESLSEVNGLHPIWQCMALARFKSLSETGNKADAMTAIPRLKTAIRDSNLVPFRQIVEDLSKKQ